MNDTAIGVLLWHWTPALLQGFALNVLMGITAMFLATLLGAVLGTLQLSPARPVQRIAAGLTQLLRNLPWLVVMFYMAWLLPFEIKLNGHWLNLPDWLKASAGLALPASGYVSEIVRGALRAIPPGQWEAARSLALDHRQGLRLIILPQALRSMVAPWMNLFCAVLMSTSLANLLGVEELMTTLQAHLAGQLRSDLLLPTYLYAFVAFFLFIFPISLTARRLERAWNPSH